jgi:hypothetical protein
MHSSGLCARLRAAVRETGMTLGTLASKHQRPDRIMRTLIGYL